MTNQILDDAFTPVTLDNLRFKGNLFPIKLKYDKRMEYLEKMHILLYATPLFFLFGMARYFMTEPFDLYYLIDTLFISAIFIVAGLFYKKNKLVVMISISILLIIILGLLFLSGELPFREIAFLLLMIIGIWIYFNAKSLENELIAAYKAGNENAYLK